MQRSRFLFANNFPSSLHQGLPLALTLTLTLDLFGWSSSSWSSICKFGCNFGLHKIGSSLGRKGHWSFQFQISTFLHLFPRNVDKSMLKTLFFDCSTGDLLLQQAHGLLGGLFDLGVHDELLLVAESVKESRLSAFFRFQKSLQLKCDFCSQIQRRETLAKDERKDFRGFSLCFDCFVCLFQSIILQIDYST